MNTQILLLYLQNSGDPTGGACCGGVIILVVVIIIFAIKENNAKAKQLNQAGYLRNSEAKQQSHIEWLLHLHSLLRKVKQLDATDRTRVLDVFRNSGNQVLQLYSDYDLFRQKTASIRG